MEVLVGVTHFGVGETVHTHGLNQKLGGREHARRPQAGAAGYAAVTTGTLCWRASRILEDPALRDRTSA